MKTKRITTAVFVPLVLMSLAVPASGQEAACWGQEPTIIGTDGADEIVGTGRRDVIAALAGRDVIRGLDGDDLLCGGIGLDKIYGGDGDDSIDGEIGPDYSYGQAGNDRLYEDQEINGFTRLVDHLNGGNGADMLESRRPSLVRGGADDDHLIGLGGLQRYREVDSSLQRQLTLKGGRGDDILEMRSSPERQRWGWVSFVGAPRPVTVDLREGIATGWGTDTLIDVHVVIGSDFDDFLTANDEGTGLDGAGGDDVLVGGASEDDLIGGPGADRISDPVGGDHFEGRAGNDVITDGDASSPHIDGGLGDDEVHGGGGDDVINGNFDASSCPNCGTEEELAGTTDADRLYGDDGNDLVTDDHRPFDDELHGGAGNDVLREGVGNDLVTGGDGDDSIEARGGSYPLSDPDQQNHFDGGTGIDTVEYRFFPHWIELHVNLTEGFARGSGEETLVGIENVLAEAHGDDVLIGNEVANILTSSWGDDVVEGRGGDDVLDGGEVTEEDEPPDFDRVDGGEGSDVCRGAEETTNCESVEQLR
ncbi:MAG: calcium-binding protein [Actinomycetota bacterium]